MKPVSPLGHAAIQRILVGVGWIEIHLTGLRMSVVASKNGRALQPDDIRESVQTRITAMRKHLSAIETEVQEG